MQEEEEWEKEDEEEEASVESKLGHSDKAA